LLNFTLSDSRAARAHSSDSLPVATVPACNRLMVSFLRQTPFGPTRLAQRKIREATRMGLFARLSPMFILNSHLSTDRDFVPATFDV
jgi:hypothetical protein